MIKFRTELYPYQQEAVAKLSRVKVGALYMEMGTGKTRTALELIAQRINSGKVSQVLWLCPYSVKRDLPELLSEHIEDLSSILICGIETLSSSLATYRKLMEYVEQAPTYLVVDESLLIKNPFTYRTKHIIEISKKCTYKLILNGTPITKNEADLFSQWYVLDWRILGYQSYYSFAANHLEMDRDITNKVVRVLNTDYLARKIAPYTYECSKSSVLKLPDKYYHSYAFDLTKEQEQHYDEVSEILIEQLNDFRPETIYRLFGAMGAITSGFGIQFNSKFTHCSSVKFFPDVLENPRIQRLIDILDEIGNHQVVIYCHYMQEIEDILSVFGDKATCFHGEMSSKRRQENKTLFKSGKVQYFVANKSCAQFGLNLQFCNYEIFYHNDWDWGTRAQAEDRLHRVGQKKDVHIYDIFADNTIDVTVLRCLNRKERLSDFFKREVRSHNKDIARAVLKGLEGGANGKGISK